MQGTCVIQEVCLEHFIHPCNKRKTGARTSGEGVESGRRGISLGDYRRGH